MLRFLLPFLILTQAAPLFAQGPPSRSDSLVAAAWASWSTDNQQLVEKQFKDAILADPSNARAYLGLSYLYELQEKQDSASGTFRSGLACLKDPYPYIFAAWLTPKIRPDAETKGGPSLELLKRVAEDAAAPSSVRASACENLARFYADHADPETARRYQQGIHPILDWTLIGPFENISASGFDKPFPPETAYDTGATYAGKEGVPAKWFAVHAARRDGWIDFKRYFASTQAVFYGHTYVYSPAERPVEIRIGTSGSLKAFLNDDLLLAYFDENNNDLDTYIIRTRLQAGWNSLLIKCGYSEIHQCNFLVRITDEQGEQIPDLAISPDVHPSPQHPGVRPMVVDNFAESFFRNQILQHPQHFENYMLLADCYLRNDKAIEAELVLRDAVALSPSCTLFHNRLLEAYVRGEKTDKISETLERLSSLDQHIPSVIEYRISRALENEEFEEA